MSGGAPVAARPASGALETSPATSSSAAPAEANGRASWRDEWAGEYGAHWAAKLWTLGLLLALGGALGALRDPDLPMHLAVGEWIARHHAVPFTEPFAWTRAGAPYYAYSWLMQLLFYGVAKLAGGVGLRLLQGVLTAAAGGVMLVLGRAARWSPETSLVMGTFNMAAAGALVAPVRPQMILFVLVPLAWACTYTLLRARAAWRPAAGLLVVSAVAAGSHIFFPLTAAPWALFAGLERRQWRRGAAVVAATVAGWLVSPYAAAWRGVFGLNFRPNALATLPSPIAELWPGFLSIRVATPVPFVLALALALLPWVVREEEPPLRRAVSAAAWLLGLVAFACAVRLLLVWWMLVLPLAARAVARIDAVVRPDRSAPPTAPRLVLLWALFAVFLLSREQFDVRAWRAERPIAARELPAPGYEQLLPLAAWLDCRRPTAGGRMLTVYNYGSQLTWRLPRFSMSVDSRAIFPDSVLASEGAMSASASTVPLPPWRSADLAILPLRSAVSQVLDSATDWRRVAVAHVADGSSALWVRGAWWTRTGADPLPAHAVAVPTSGPQSCAMRAP